MTFADFELAGLVELDNDRCDFQDRIFFGIEAGGLDIDNNGQVTSETTFQRYSGCFH